MTRLLAHVEGRTEEEFVNEVLAPHLHERGYHSVKARLMGKARQRFKRGGIKPWPSVRKEIVNHLREDPGCIATTMVDYYGMPREGSGAWPGRSLALGAEFQHKARTIEERIAAHVSEDMGAGFDNRRFVPYVMMHEYEAMLFSDCAVFANGIGRPEITQPLQAMRDRFDTPEEIDDSPESAPSARITALFPGYEKPIMGCLAAMAVGLDRIRAECPNFHNWIDRLERLGARNLGNDTHY